MKKKTRIGTLKIFRYLVLVFVLIFGLASILATGGGGGGGVVSSTSPSDTG